MAEEILYPVGEEQTECAICGNSLSNPLSSTYPNIICWECEQRAVTADGEEPKNGAAYREKVAERDTDAENIPTDAGDNPVFIDGQKCWRRYRFGGYITRLDQFDCDDILEFRKNHRP